ncbi:SHOCT domain-containing protein [Maridesulfovibrio bastinii]|uniref:SHOCT domain-containing protein n=1 Tax=Maridesulfovibrio bastinii TaxID=47157 RepID=UPI00041AB621|nr:SHOCT domain-containing protein [Maridesulfovibrio bastinii]
MFTGGWNGFCPNGFQGGYMHGGFMGGGLMGGGGFVGLIFNILIIALVAYLIFKLVQNLNNNNVQRNEGTSRSNRVDTGEILRERFARGDISEEEYLRKKDILGN